MPNQKTINKDRDELNIVKFGEAKVSGALAAAYIDLESEGTTQSDAVKTAISNLMKKRNKTNIVTGIIVYEKTASGKNKMPERTAPVVYNNVERAL